MKDYTEKGFGTLLLSFDVDSCQRKGFHTTNEKSGTGGFWSAFGVCGRVNLQHYRWQLRNNPSGVLVPSAATQT